MNTEPKIYSEAEFTAVVHQARIETHNGICEQINAAHAAHNETVTKLHQGYQAQQAETTRAHHEAMTQLQQAHQEAQAQWTRKFNEAVEAAVAKALATDFDATGSVQ
ncbi:MAG TPA: hypothetical protein VNW52_07800 [Burkholderiaceae bacterium]|jgi:hypothetical protein|nr:hypothetical protein [Burkholderiaceae bacterium]